MGLCKLLRCIVSRRPRIPRRRIAYIPSCSMSSDSRKVISHTLCATTSRSSNGVLSVCLLNSRSFQPTCGDCRPLVHSLQRKSVATGTYNVFYCCFTHPEQSATSTSLHVSAIYIQTFKKRLKPFLFSRSFPS